MVQGKCPALVKALKSVLEGNILGVIIADRFNIPLRLKHFVVRKTYLMGGYQWEFDLLNKGWGYPNPKPRQEFFLGVGHEVNPNMMFEAKLVQPIDNSNFDKLGFEKVKTRLELGTRVKF